VIPDRADRWLIVSGQLSAVSYQLSAGHKLFADRCPLIATLAAVSYQRGTGC
jgi:hypothetical protein